MQEMEDQWVGDTRRLKEANYEGLGQEFRGTEKTKYRQGSSGPR